MTILHKHLRPYLVQMWRGETLVNSIDGLSLDAARHIAQTHAGLGDTVRLWADNGTTDYIEVYTPNGAVRVGDFASTTFVHVQA